MLKLIVAYSFAICIETSSKAFAGNLDMTFDLLSTWCKTGNTR